MTKTLLVIIIGFGLFFRTFRVDALLLFLYDQGRDALVIWDLIHNGKLSLIGPTTGIEGVFLGPFYYLLLLPPYLISGGDPKAASFFISILSGLGVVFIYIIGANFSKVAGLLSAFLAGFSYMWISNDRWLANPTPVSFFAPLAFFMFWKAKKNPTKFFPIAMFLMGLNLQLEASGSFLLMFAVLIWVYFSKIYTNFKALIFGVVAFILTLLPQALFELRHNYLITKNILKFFNNDHSGNGGFNLPTLVDIQTRLGLIFQSLMEKIEPSPSNFSFFVLIVTILGVSLYYKKLNSDLLKLILIWVITPVCLFMFFRGNEGYIFAYYLNPVIPIVFVFLGVGLWSITKIFKLWGKLVVITICAIFLVLQFQYKNYFLDGLGGFNTIALENQKKAIDWIYHMAENRQFNVDVYVPPVIPFAYDYLFLWYGQKKYGYLPAKENIEELYTIHEYDSFIDRKNKWIKRQLSIGKIEKEASFGGITVEKRQRI